MSERRREKGGYLRREEWRRKRLESRRQRDGIESKVHNVSGTLVGSEQILISTRRLENVILLLLLFLILRTRAPQHAARVRQRRLEADKARKMARGKKLIKTSQ